MDYFFLYHFLHQQRQQRLAARKDLQSLFVLKCYYLFAVYRSVLGLTRTIKATNSLQITYPATSIGRKIRFYEKYRRTKLKRGEIFTLLR